jgi:hypothetical protein
VWLQRRCEDARTGTLAPAFRKGLAVLPGWEGKPRAEADEERWHERLAELKAYLAAGNDWPRYKATITGEEHGLGIWLHGQRLKQRRGQLDADKAAALDDAMPGWRTGRKRGRRPAFSTNRNELLFLRSQSTLRVPYSNNGGLLRRVLLRHGLPLHHRVRGDSRVRQ